MRCYYCWRAVPVGRSVERADGRCFLSNARPVTQTSYARCPVIPTHPDGRYSFVNRRRGGTRGGRVASYKVRIGMCAFFFFSLRLELPKPVGRFCIIIVYTTILRVSIFYTGCLAVLQFVPAVKFFLFRLVFFFFFSVSDF